MATKSSGFAQMPKMMTTEPSVILKLKKGGHVSKKSQEEHGHMAMQNTAHSKKQHADYAMDGDAPKKPSMSDRRKAMSGALLNSKKGGKVVKKAIGGMMGAPMGAAPMGAAPMGAMMSPAVKRAMMMKRMQQRGAMPAVPGQAQPGMMKKGGSAKGSDMAQDKAMIKKAFKQHDTQEHMGGKGTKLKLKNGGAAMDKFGTKTTIEGNEAKFAKTKVNDGDKTDKAHGTGAVKMGKPAGYKTGGTIEGNEAKFAKTKVVDGDKTDKAHGTGGVRMANAGGFKEGGSMNWENRPADTAKPGKTNTTTGGVKEGNAGGYKKGGAAKKHFATGGSVNNAGHAVAMPRKPASKPVANTMQSGTFKKGGKVMHKAEGGDLSKGAYDKSFGPDESDMAMAEAIRSAPGNAYRSVMRLLGKELPPTGAGAGRGSTNPPMARKRGGLAKC